MKTLITLLLLVSTAYASENTRIDCKMRVSSLEQFTLEMNFLSKTEAKTTFFLDMGAGELRIEVPKTEVKLGNGKRIVSTDIKINSMKTVTVHLPEEIFSSKKEFDVESSSGSYVTDTYCWAK